MSVSVVWLDDQRAPSAPAFVRMEHQAMNGQVPRKEQSRPILGPAFCLDQSWTLPRRVDLTSERRRFCSSRRVFDARLGLVFRLTFGSTLARTISSRRRLSASVLFPSCPRWVSALK